MIYRSLFNLILHHAYFLDKGENLFLDMSAEEQVKRLRAYRVSDFLKFVPSRSTQHNINRYRLVLKPHSQGFRIVAKAIEETGSDSVQYTPIIELPNDLTLTFGLYITDPHFENYTQITSKADNGLYLFSNLKPDSEASDFANIFSSDVSADPDFLLTEEGARQIVHTIVSEDEFFNSHRDRFSIAHIDKTSIDDPGNVALLEEYIKSQKNKGLIAFVRVTVKGSNDHNLLEFDESDPGNIKQYVWNSPLKFTLSFKNRRTFWRYNGDFDDAPLITADTKPLVKNGFVQIESADFNPEPVEEHHFPNPKVNLIKKEDSNYYSDIFI
ncbi:hypothetical protein [uncultured Kriegella sp.]|mgnify:CR=1 FL=1|uniref:hypothetical protein n=1 Tax=uncultured Kriegella sp. TaxID=1798910 RepID=UPI0030D99C7C|tara:strand:+ start:336900 stop:337877 length:978 start_codon:yes stop_codon:yes gene_type:complete